MLIPDGLEEPWLAPTDGPGLRALEPLLEPWDPEGWEVVPPLRSEPEQRQLPLFPPTG